MTHPSHPLHGLPHALLRRVPEAALPWTPEPGATCATCPMLDQGWTKVRCCTYHPFFPSYLLGRMLQDPEAAPRVRARISRGVGVGPLGIEPGQAWLRRFHATPFGTDLRLRCPLWVEGEWGCSAWPLRPIRCRTWFCSHAEGEAGASAWTALDAVLHREERVLCEEIAARLGSRGERAWEDWYRLCAEAV